MISLRLIHGRPACPNFAMMIPTNSERVANMTKATRGRYTLEFKQEAVLLPVPIVAITGNNPAAALDLDQENASARDHEGIELVNGAVVGDELEIGVKEIWVAIRQALAQKLQRSPLVRESRLSKAFPSCFRESHTESSLSPQIQ